MPSSLSQEPPRGDACFWSSTFSPSSGRQKTCGKLPPQHAIDGLEEKDPTSKQFNDVEWIRSLTEAQEVTTCGRMSRVEFWRSVRERNCSLDDFDAAYRSGYRRRRRGLGHLSSAPQRRVDGRLTQRTASQKQGRRKELFWNDRNGRQCARRRRGLSLPAHGSSSSVETSKLVSC